MKPNMKPGVRALVSSTVARPAFGLFRQRREHERGRVLPFRGRKVLLHQRHRLIRLEIPGDGQHGVVGRVVQIVKILHPVELGGVEICHRADGRVRVRRVALEHQLAQANGAGHVGLVLDAHAELFFDHGALILEILRRDRQPAHAVGLEPQGELELVGGQHLVVVGAVAVGGAVEAAAAIRRSSLKCSPFLACLLPWNIMCSNKCAKPVRPRPRARADAVGHRDRHGRRRVIRVHDHLQAVVQRGALNRQPEALERNDCGVRCGGASGLLAVVAATALRRAGLGFAGLGLALPCRGVGSRVRLVFLLGLLRGLRFRARVSAGGEGGSSRASARNAEQKGTTCASPRHLPRWGRVPSAWLRALRRVRVLRLETARRLARVRCRRAG